MIGPAGIGEQTVDHEDTAFLLRIGEITLDLRLGRRHADGVEVGTAQEGEIVGRKRQFETIHVELRPGCSFLNPLREHRDLLLREPLALRRHEVIARVGSDAIDQRAALDVARRHRRSIRLAPLQGRQVQVETETAFRLAALVAAVTLRLEERLHLLEIIDLRGMGGVKFDLHLHDAVGDEMIDRILRRKTLGQGRHLDRLDLREPALRRSAARRPIGRGRSAFRGPGFRIDLRIPAAALSLVGGPARVVVSDLTLAGRHQRPALATLERNRRDRLAEFGPSFALARDASDHRLEDHEVLAALRFELDPGLAVAGWDKTEVRTEVEVFILLLEVTVATRVRFRKGILQHHLAVDVQLRGAAATEEEPVFSGRQLHQRRGAKMRGHRAVRPHPGGDVFLRPFEKAKHVLLIGLRHLGLVRPRIGLRHALFADLHQHLPGRHHLARHRRRGRRVGITRLELLRLGGAAMDREIVQPTAERLARGALVARADDEIVRIGHRTQIRRPAHIPDAGGRLAVDEDAEAILFAEGVDHRDMMPSRRRNLRGAPPAVPLALAAVRGVDAREEETHLGAAARALETDRIILVVLTEIGAQLAVASLP